MFDRMPEDLPGTKCINVMVGITRSKVFLFKHLVVNANQISDLGGEFLRFSGVEISLDLVGLGLFPQMSMLIRDSHPVISHDIPLFPSQPGLPFFWSVHGLGG